MERPPRINGTDVAVTLELMGLTLIYEAGTYRVYLDPRSNERIVYMESRWDMPADEVEQILVSNNLSMEEFWRAYQSLYVQP